MLINVNLVRNNSNLARKHCMNLILSFSTYNHATGCFFNGWGVNVVVAYIYKLLQGCSVSTDNDHKDSVWAANPDL